MKIEEIKELIQALEQSSLTSLEINQGEICVKLAKNAATPMLQATPMEESSEILKPAIPISQPNRKEITSPLVGVFYAAPSPNDVPFVMVGDTVKKGDVLCIVEAMKLMNEITAEQDGIITEVCVENGQVVEYGQPLFYLA